MAAHDFFRRRSLNRYQFIRVLPERVKMPARITYVFDNFLRSNGIDLLRVTINEFPGRIFQLLPILISQE